ncbi:ABC transporter permease [Planococcus halocryophilus]|uniref:ABC-2 type transporter transmembrane domain-containing protein n=1 Tax=Planococcus halocryophilus TaxID=1215089 RepID=A0A1C7DUA3_9BACL|nr:ABC transporter permease [Planococcus halocryophilus]ANU15220.1 hypothetical protein BBI08_15770 [Planococcus halocryophilus]
MFAFLVKDIMLLLRDRSQLLILLAMPFLLIAILGFSLRGIFSGDLEALEMDVALVALDDEAQAVEQIQNEIESMDLQQAENMALKQAAESAKPQTLFISLLESESLNKLITLEKMDQAQANESLEEKAIDAVIIIPAGFSEAALRNMLFGASGTGELEVVVADLSSTKAEILNTIVNEFVQTVNFEASFTRLAGGDIPLAEVLGEEETITTRPPISSFQYYTIGMAVMFVLFTGSTLASQANLEQTQMVFDRIRLSNRPPLLYLGSKALAAAAIVFVQLTLLFGLSALLFQTFPVNSWSFWSGMAIISTTLAIAVGCLAALMVALTLKLESDAVPAIFSGGIISLLGIVGGSFMPIESMPEILQAIGNWTPNGAALTAYFSWILQPDTSRLWLPLLRIAATAVLFLLVALALFPRKGGVA